jgi:RNA polymerase sigma factor (TIGR02999 family)
VSIKAFDRTGPVTALLQAWSAGDPRAQEALVPLVYRTLRQRAAAQLRRERKDHTLQPTALVHEAYLRLAAQRSVDWRSRLHFLALASTVMRRVLVDYARARDAAKRPAEELRVALEGEVARIDPRGCELLLLDQSLNELADLDPRQARALELVYFGGLTETEAADVLSTSRSTVVREMRSAKAWLYRRMTAGRVKESR